MLKIVEGLGHHEEDAGANNIPLLRRLKDLYIQLRRIYSSIGGGGPVPCSNAFMCEGYEIFQPEFMKYHSLVSNLVSRHPAESSWVSTSKKYFSNLGWNRESINVGWMELYLASKRVYDDTHGHQSGELKPVHSLHELITIAFKKHSTQNDKFSQMAKLHKETMDNCACMGALLHATNKWRQGFLHICTYIKK